MKKGILMSLFMFCAGAAAPAQDFMDQQKRYQRVREAYEQKGEKVGTLLSAKGIGLENVNVLFVAYKAEKKLEVWAKKKTDAAYGKLTEYSVCRSSGQLGPKRKKGDRQVPEGFYHIDRFNPASSYHLSLGINYPNSADKIRSGANDPGGDIFIHGACVTIGCLPMTDDKIKEIYILAVSARNNGQSKIPVYIFPFRMDEANMKKYAAAYSEDEELLKFWGSLKKGYDLFTRDKKELRVQITSQGAYSF